MRPLRYKSTLRIAIENALRNKGINVPENVSGPELVTGTWQVLRSPA